MAQFNLPYMTSRHVCIRSLVFLLPVLLPADISVACVRVGCSICILQVLILQLLMIQVKKAK